MSSKTELIGRVRELRRRHFGARGKAEFARRLGLTAEEYEPFERSRIPPGDVMLRMCETTGEDLQWLLTGVAARSTLVISNAAHRHQQLLGNIARRLESQPELASPLEAFFDLLTRSVDMQPDQAALPAPDDRDLIPVLRPEELPARLPESPAAAVTRILARRDARHVEIQRSAPVRLREPHADAPDRGAAAANLIAARDNGATRQFVQAAAVARCFPAAFGIELTADLDGLAHSGDVLLVAPDSPPAVGRPAVCHVKQPPLVRGGLWLGADQGGVRLGDPGEHAAPERIAADDVHWSLEVLYRVSLN